MRKKYLKNITQKEAIKLEKKKRMDNEEKERDLKKKRIGLLTHFYGVLTSLMLFYA